MVVGTKESYRTRASAQRSFEVQSVYLVCTALLKLLLMNLCLSTTSKCELRVIFARSASIPVHCHDDENMRCDHLCRSLSHPHRSRSRVFTN